MSRNTVANLVARLDADTARFQRQMTQAHNQTQRYQRTANQASTASRQMSASFQRAANATAVLNGPLNGVSGRLSFIASGMRNVGAAGLTLGVGVTATAAGLVRGIREAERFERQYAVITAQLNATEQASGKTTNELITMARRTARESLASTDDIIRAQQQLLRFTAITGDNFERTIKLAQDYAVVTGGDASSAAERLGRILEDPINAFSRLRREGIILNESQRQTITQMMELGNTAQAQAAILSMLEGRIGGAAGAENIGVAGAWDGLTQSMGEFFIAAGHSTRAGQTIQTALEGIDNALQRRTRGFNAANSSYFDEDRAREELENINSLIEHFQGQLDNSSRFRLFGNERSWRSMVEMLEEEQSQITQRIEEHERAKGEARQAARNAEEAREIEASQERQRKEEETRNQELQRQQAHSLQLIQALDLRYTDAEGKRELAHQRQLEQIRSLYADEEAIRSLGFQNLEQMQQWYLDNEVAQYQKQGELIAQERAEREQAERAAAEERIQQIMMRTMSDAEIMNLRHEEELAELEAFNEAKLLEDERYIEMKEALEKAHQDKLDEINTRNLLTSLGNYEQLFDGIAGLTAVFAGKQSGLYKSMFAASKGFAVAQSTIKIITGIAEAAANPWPLNLAAMAKVGSATAGLVSSIQGTQLAGARANGGPVSPGMWLVGERGPEILNLGGGTGQITSNENLRAALNGSESQGVRMEQHYHFEALDHEHALDLFARERGALTDAIIRELEDRGISL